MTKLEPLIHQILKIPERVKSSFKSFTKCIPSGNMLWRRMDIKFYNVRLLPSLGDVGKMNLNEKEMLILFCVRACLKISV